MNIIVISLKRANERREKMFKQLNDLKLLTLNTHNVIIMDAIDGNDLSDEDKSRKIYLPNGYRFGDLLKPGEVGCTLSHIKALKIAKENNWENVIILEDDIILADDFEKRLSYLFKLLPSSWEHVYLSGIPKISHNPPILFFAHILPSNFTQCTHSMLIKHTAYDKIIEKLSLFETTTDDMYCDLLKKLKSYTYYPFVTYVDSPYTYIQDAKLYGDHPSKQYYKNKI